MSTASCAKCHEKSFNDIKQEIKSQIAFPFKNKGGFLGAENPRQYFRVPLLRNSVSTKPYFHNGSVEKLEEAIKIMGTHQSRTDISDNEIHKIVSFLKAVNGKVVDFKFEQ